MFGRCSYNSCRTAGARSISSNTGILRRQQRQTAPRPRSYASTTPKSNKTKDLPPPLPPKQQASAAANNTSKSPAAAKREYLEAQKRTGEFLKDPRANIARIQNELDATKAKLLTVHNKPIWRRIVDRTKAKQHAVINLLAASMAYLLAHRLHLQMKANRELEERVGREADKNAELRALLRKLAGEEFSRGVVSEATAATNGDNNNRDAPAAASGRSPWFWQAGATPESAAETGSSESLPFVGEDALVAALRSKLEEGIGDEGLEDADRKKKEIERIWKENEDRIVVGLSSSAAAAHGETGNNNNSSSEEEQGLSAALSGALLEEPGTVATAAAGTPSPTKKRVFDM